MAQLYRQVLLFPNRAENLDRFSAYQVRLEHWRPLSIVFQDAFRNVFERGESSLLLIHGAQGTGKTLFARRLHRDFEEVREGRITGARENLWHALAGDAEDPSIIEQATRASTLHTVVAENGWLEGLRSRYRKPEHNVRIFICDDAHKVGFLRPWAGISQEQYLSLTATKSPDFLLPVVADRMVELCRSDFLRSIFILLSVDSGVMRRLHTEIERSHRGLSRLIELPLPDAATKEEIVRQNTNRLNAVSYWYCLDGAGPKGKEGVYKVLHEKRGFTDSFEAVDEALKSSVGRTGRPPNQNVITLCTLASDPRHAKGFITTNDLPLEEEFLGEHIGVWFSARQPWASALATGLEAEIARRGALVESEFVLRWVALGVRATHVLCNPAAAPELAARLLSVLKFFPSVAKPRERERLIEEIRALNTLFAGLDAMAGDFAALERRFAELGQRRSTVYEPALRAQFNRFGEGFAAYRRLRPDVILSEYTPCSISAATPGTSDAIKKAIRRTGRTIEFTSFLDEGMKGLGSYLIEKVTAYAIMLESV